MQQKNEEQYEFPFISKIEEIIRENSKEEALKQIEKEKISKKLYENNPKNINPSNFKKNLRLETWQQETKELMEQQFLKIAEYSSLEALNRMDISNLSEKTKEEFRKIYKEAYDKNVYMLNNPHFKELMNKAVQLGSEIKSEEERNAFAKLDEAVLGHFFDPSLHNNLTMDTKAVNSAYPKGTLMSPAIEPILKASPEKQTDTTELKNLVSEIKIEVSKAEKEENLTIEEKQEIMEAKQITEKAEKLLTEIDPFYAKLEDLAHSTASQIDDFSRQDKKSEIRKKIPISCTEFFKIKGIPVPSKKEAMSPEEAFKSLDKVDKPYLFPEEERESFKNIKALKWTSKKSTNSIPNLKEFKSLVGIENTEEAEEMTEKPKIDPKNVFEMFRSISFDEQCTLFEDDHDVIIDKVQTAMQLCYGDRFTAREARETIVTVLLLAKLFANQNFCEPPKKVAVWNCSCRICGTPVTGSGPKVKTFCKICTDSLRLMPEFEEEGEKKMIKYSPKSISASPLKRVRGYEDSNMDDEDFDFMAEDDDMEDFGPLKSSRNLIAKKISPFKRGSRLKAIEE